MDAQRYRDAEVDELAMHGPSSRQGFWRIGILMQLRCAVMMTLSLAPKGSTFRPGSRGDSCLDADHGVKGSRSCPDSEVRKSLRHTLMRTSESKGHEQLYGSGAPLNPKFAIGLAAHLCELRVAGTSRRRSRP